MLTRTFHPVGQGAFYTEEHVCASRPGNSYFIVYDCGNWRNEIFSQQIIEAIAKQFKIIDILFISHFDYDHISGINILLKHCHIRRVVLPLLHRIEKSLLASIYNVLGYDEAEHLIRDPESYFSSNTIVTYVEPSNNYEPDDNENDFDSNHREQLDIDADIIAYDSTKKCIPSKSAIILNKCSWAYIPYNMKFSPRNSQLIKEIKSAGLSVSILLNNPSYLNKHRKTIKEVYERLDGNINENSMLVYSGPLLTSHSHQRKFHTYTYPIFYYMIGRKLERVGCLYTGDANLNKINSRSVFRRYWSNIGTIQIPHHGDEKSLCSSILIDKHYVCPYSYGTKNPYKHPSPVLPTILDSAISHSVEVTEDPAKTYKETIKC